MDRWWEGFPRIKIYLSDAEKDGQAAINFFTHERYGSNQEGSAELEKLLSHKGIFDNPKPVRLITWRILLWETRRNGLVLCYAGDESVMRFDDAGEASKTGEIRL